MKSQKENIELLKQNYPDYPFEYQHYSTDYITNMRNTATDEVGGVCEKEIHLLLDALHLLALQQRRLDELSQLAMPVLG